MNRTEALEKYGAKQVKFASYYKYGFSFTGDGLIVCLNGDVSDIYRLSVQADKTYTVAVLMEECPVSIYEGERLIYEQRW